MDLLLGPARPILTPAIALWGNPVTWLEIVAFALSLWMVACNMRVNLLGWPLTIVSSLLYGLLFADSRLYGEASLKLLFVALAFWGWWLEASRPACAARCCTGQPHDDAPTARRWLAASRRHRFGGRPVQLGARGQTPTVSHTTCRS